MTDQTGMASITIDCSVSEVFAAITDVTRMGEWSPENTGARWVDAVGPALGAKFEGDNEAKLGPLTLKKWTTTSEVTAFEEPAVFEFVAEGYTKWRYEFSEGASGTTVTETVSYPAYSGIQKVLFNVLGSRQKQIVRGMEKTLAQLKASLES